MNRLEKVRHIVLVILENRSFDHLLGWLSHPKYGNDTRYTGLSGSVGDTGTIRNPDYENDGQGWPFYPYFTDVDLPFVSDLPHGRGEVTTQLDWDPFHSKFRMRGFAASYLHEHPIMSTARPPTPENLMMLAPTAAPMTAFLARNYRACDHWFAPIPTDTHPNRFMAWAGYTKIETTKGGFPEPDHRLLFDWATENGVSWRVYSQGFSFASLMLNRLPQTLTDRDHFRRFSSLAADIQRDDFPQLVIVEPAYADDPLASTPDDNHPPFPMAPGEGFLLELYRALYASPEWSNTMMFVYYDEHGGLFDHVTPLSVATPCGADDPNAWAAFATTGPRVPAIAVSPLVEPNVPFSDNVDHTSVLQFLAEVFTPGKPYSTQVRDRHADGTLTSLTRLLTLDDARPTPGPPSLGPFPKIAFPSGRPALTDGQKAFLAARQKAHLDHPDDTAEVHPETFFRVTK